MVKAENTLILDIRRLARGRHFAWVSWDFERSCRSLGFKELRVQSKNEVLRVQYEDRGTYLGENGDVRSILESWCWFVRL